MRPVDSTVATCMTTVSSATIRTRKFDQSGPNLSRSVRSHRENMEQKDVSERLNKLKNFNVLSDNMHGKYPTPGLLIMSSVFGRPSRKHSFTSDVHFDHIVLPLLKSGI